MSTLDDYMRRFAHLQQYQPQNQGYNPAQSINEPGGQKPHPSIDGGPVSLDGSWAGSQGGDQWMDRSRWLNGTGGSQQPGGGPGYLGPPQQWPPPGGQMGWPQQQGMGPASIYDVFNSAVPLMNSNRDRQIGQSMATAGMGGTRFGTASENNVARIGADTALQQDQMLTNLMYQQGQADADRSLQASQQSMQLAQIYDQMQRSRIDQLSGVGMWEQGRGDQLSMFPYQDFENNKNGYLDYILAAMGGVGAPQQQQPITTTQGGGPSWWDYAMQGGMTAAMMYGAFSDERLKTDIRRFPLEVIPGVPLAAWRWKHSGEAAAGVIAQDLEKVRPDLVGEVGGYKTVYYGGLR